MIESPALRHALIRHLDGDGRRWLEFRDPVDTITATTLGEVPAAIAAAEAAQQAGRWVVGAISYDAGPAFDPALTSRRHPRCPLVAFGVFDGAAPSRGPAGGRFDVGPVTTHPDGDRYRADLERIRRHIADGDTYQVNYTMRLRASFAGDPLGLFAAMCRAQRADHVAYLDLGDQAFASVSPELFLRRRGDLIETRPMKGTRPRHPDPRRDRDLADDLAASAKDRAENTMIVDMTRNDLGRIATTGSVTVTALHTVETYPTVHQLTSTVTARSDASLMDLLRACFPAASITGAPKVRTTALIAELEAEPRGIYTGAIGVLDPRGGIELNVAIRTAHVDRPAGQVEYGVGGGIVWDSDIDDEWAEAHAKARVLTRSATPFRLLETIAWEPRVGPVLLERHLRRLARSADHFGFDIDIDEVRRAAGAVSTDRSGIVRILVASDGAFALEPRPRPDHPDVPWSVPVDTVPVSADDEMLRHKTTARHRYDEARARWPGHPDVLLVNDRGELTESTMANLVVDLDGRLLTPPVEAGLLPGTFRAELLDSGLITEETLRPEDLDRARSIHLINSVRGWIPIRIAIHAPSTDNNAISASR